MKGFECTGALLRLYQIISLIVLKCRALNVFLANLRHRNAEGSLIQCRAFGQLVDSKKHFGKTPKALLQKQSFVAMSLFHCCRAESMLRFSPAYFALFTADPLNKRR